jgi:hypothetical protein
MSLGLVVIGVTVCVVLIALITIHGVLNHDIGYRKGYADGMAYVNEQWLLSLRDGEQ